MPCKDKAAKAAYDAKRYAEDIGEKKRAASRVWYAENRERGKAKSAARYRAKTAEILASQAEKRRAAIAVDGAFYEKERAASRRRYAANPKLYRATSVAFYKRLRERDPDRQARDSRRRYWNDPEKARARGVLDVANRRARLADAGGRITASDVDTLRERQKGKCAFCLEPLGTKTPHVDHYVAIARGGSNDLRNLRLLHRLCNMKKHAKHPQDFALENGLLAW